MKSIGFLRKLQLILPHQYLLTIYKSSIRPHLCYDVAVYDQPSNYSHYQKIKSFQHRVLAITATLKGTSRKKMDEMFVFGLQNTFNENTATYLQLSFIYDSFLKTTK